MKIKINKKGLRYVDLFRVVGKPERFGIHVLVALVFIGPNPGGKIVCHQDDNCAHNHVSNLYYGTKASNMEDAKRNGKYSLGENRYNASLTNEQVRLIRKLHAAGMRPSRIAAHLCVRRQRVSSVVHRQTYKSVQ